MARKTWRNSTVSRKYVENLLNKMVCFVDDLFLIWIRDQVNFYNKDNFLAKEVDLWRRIVGAIFNKISYS